MTDEERVRFGSYLEIWPERVLGAVFGDPSRLYEYDPDDPASSWRR